MATLPCTTAVTWLGRLALACVPVPLAPIRLQHWLATPYQQRHNAPAPFNSGTGIGVPNSQGGQPPKAAFFASVRNTVGASFSMAGHGGSVLARAGFLDAGTPIPPCACPPRLASGGGSNLVKETCTMSSIALRVVRALFPVFSVPVSTVPTHTKACAMARLLVSQGKRVAIVPVATGLTVSEVKA